MMQLNRNTSWLNVVLNKLPFIQNLQNVMNQCLNLDFEIYLFVIVLLIQNSAQYLTVHELPSLEKGKFLNCSDLSAC